MICLQLDALQDKLFAGELSIMRTLMHIKLQFTSLWGGLFVIEQTLISLVEIFAYQLSLSVD